MEGEDPQLVPLPAALGLAHRHRGTAAGGGGYFDTIDERQVVLDAYFVEYNTSDRTRVAPCRGAPR